MKVWHVYELINSNGIVEYVGETINTKRRMYQHTKVEPKVAGHGKFYQRLDIKMNIVKQFDNRKDAWLYQCQLQKQNGLITDGEIVTKTKIGNKNCVGRFISTETRSKIGEKNKGKQSWNKGKKGCQIAWNKGKTHSDETKQKMREARLKYLQNKNI